MPPKIAARQRLPNNPPLCTTIPPVIAPSPNCWAKPFAAVVLFEATGLIEDVVYISGVDKEVREDLGALGVVAGEAGFPGRTLPGLLACRVHRRRG